MWVCDVFVCTYECVYIYMYYKCMYREIVPTVVSSQQHVSHSVFSADSSDPTPTDPYI